MGGEDYNLIQGLASLIFIVASMPDIIGSPMIQYYDIGFKLFGKIIAVFPSFASPITLKLESSLRKSIIIFLYEVLFSAMIISIGGAESCYIHINFLMFYI